MNVNYHNQPGPSGEHVTQAPHPSQHPSQDSFFSENNLSTKRDSMSSPNKLASVNDAHSTTAASSSLNGLASSTNDVNATTASWALKKFNAAISYPITVDDSPLIHALKNLDQVYRGSNAQENRRTLLSTFQTDALEASKKVLEAFSDAHHSLQVLRRHTNNMQSSLQSITQRLSDARLGASAVVSQTSHLRQQLTVAERKAKAARMFVKTFTLNAEEEFALSKNEVTVQFLDALNRLEQVHELSKTVLQSKYQRAGLEVMEMAAARREDAYEKLYRFVQAECGTLDVDTSDDENKAVLLRKAVRSLQSRPVLLRYCAEEVGSVRRAQLLERFIVALTRGGPGGVPRPIEFHAHDPLRYTNDMLAWIHQALASEKELMTRLFANSKLSPSHQDPALGLDKNTTMDNKADPSGVSSSSSHKVGPLEDSNSQEDLALHTLNTTFDALCRPFRLRFEQSLEPLPTVVNLYKLASLLEFYANTMKQLLGENAEFPATLLECNSVAMYAFFTSWKTKMSEFQNAGLTPSKDLSPPTPVLQSMVRLEDILNTLDASLTSAESRETQVTAVLEVILNPLLQMCKSMSMKSLAPLEQQIFMANCVEVIRNPLVQFKFASERVQNLVADAESYVDKYTQIAFAVVLRRCGLRERYRRMKETDENTPLSTAPGMDLEGISISLKNFYAILFSESQLSGADGDPLSPPKVEKFSNPRMKNRARQTVASLVAHAHRALHNAVLDPKNRYGPNAAMAVGLRDPDKVEEILNGRIS